MKIPSDHCNQNYLQMKKIKITLIGLIFWITGMTQTTSIQLTFSAIDSVTQSPLALDSLKVINIDEDCDTVLYDSVSILNLDAIWPVGMTERDFPGQGALKVFQNRPNPFEKTTRVSIFLAHEGPLDLALFNAEGKALTAFQIRLEKGLHLFRIETVHQGILILRVTDQQTAETIRLINHGEGMEESAISYLGSTGGKSIGLKSAGDTSGFIFYFGNQLRYTAYVAGYSERTLCDNPTTNQSYQFDLPCAIFVCGAPIVKNHIAGNVAPVNKTVTYGTIGNIPGEPAKCWITSNLGAAHQATAVNDATEASAGWYWQFNRKQGYRHDGIMRTPNSAWTDYISEASDWLPANDPCTAELGAGWRLPTNTEWTNVDAAGNWNNWNDAWNSVLKLHAAGNLESDNGSLYVRGELGLYWSSVRFSLMHGRFLNLDWSGCYMGYAPKAYGFPLRCIQE
jgi:hypothetical protein